MTTIRSDNEGGIEALKQPLQALGVKLEFAGPGKHAPAAENGIRILKSIARAAKYSVNWPLPRIAVVASVAFATIAMSLSRSQLNPHIPPPITQFSGMQMDFAMHEHTKFGSMAYAEVAHTNNTSDPRSTPVIVLYPILCATKKVAVWDLESDTLLERSGKITVVPTTAECIKFITAKHAREVRAGKLLPPTLNETDQEPFADMEPVDGPGPHRITVEPGTGQPFNPIAGASDRELQPRRIQFQTFDNDTLGRMRSSTAALRHERAAEGIKGVGAERQQEHTPELRVQREIRAPDMAEPTATEPYAPFSPAPDRYAHGPGVSSPSYWNGPTTRSPAQMMGGGYIEVNPAETVTPVRLADEFALAEELRPGRQPPTWPLPTKTTPGKPKPSKPAPGRRLSAATELAGQARDRRAQDAALVMTIKQGVQAFGELALKAISGELEQMVTKKVWRPVHWKAMTDAERKRVLPSSMFLKEKKDSAGKVEKIKARLVAGGHRQDKSL